MQKTSIDNCVISQQTSHDPKIYPVKSIYNAFEILRLYQVGRMKSVQATSDKVQISVSREVTTWMHPTNGTAVELDIGNRKDVLYVNLTLALQEVFKGIDEEDLKRKAFIARYIGVKDPNSDTGDAITMSIKQIAEEFHRSLRTIQHWCQTLREEYTQVLVRRGLLDPIYLN